MSQRLQSSKKVTVANVVEEKNLRLALATHDNVVRDSHLFNDTLEKFHSALGFKIQEPMVGKKRISLHALYVEVTKRGGYEKVIGDNKWREIAKVFEFPPTTTSASYTLRKHYHTLLHDYELMYFHPENPKLKETEPPLQITGYIDGKFDSGYLITAKIGDEWLNGVLYHPADHVHTPTPPLALLPQTVNSIVPYDPPVRQRGRGIKRQIRRDHGRPKKSRSGYNFFFSDKYAELKSSSLYPIKKREITKMIAQAWNMMPPAEKAVYQERGVNDKARYKRELTEHGLGVMGEVVVQQLNSNKVMGKESGKAKE